MKNKLLKVISSRGAGDMAFWKRKSYAERLSALEQVRRVIFGYDPSSARLQRTFTITKLKKD